jgi:hypothetical protein
MRILIALAVVVVFGAAMLFDTAALVQLLLIAVTGDYGAHPMWLLVEGGIVAALVGLAVVRRLAVPVKAAAPVKAGAAAKNARVKKPGAARAAGAKAAPRKKAKAAK